MRISGDDEARDLRTHIRARGVGIRQEETLAVGPSIRAFVVERLALLLERGFERVQREMNSPVVGGVFSLSEQSVLLNSCAGVGYVLRVLVGDALAALVVLFAVFGGPPVAQIAVCVELAAPIVQAVDDLLSDDQADRAGVH